MSGDYGHLVVSYTEAVELVEVLVRDLFFLNQQHASLAYSHQHHRRSAATECYLHDGP